MQPLLHHRYSCSNSYEFVDKVRAQDASCHMVSYDVTSLFTDVPLRETNLLESIYHAACGSCGTISKRVEREKKRNND